MKLRLLFTAIILTGLLGFLSTVTLAQGEPPSPYAGLKNPFPWGDASAQETGKALYKQSCLGCHGIKGNNIPASDFSAADYSQSLEARPDFYFWVLSEGRLDKGMPPFKSSLSEEQRWQVLTYIRSLGAETPAEPVPSTVSPATEGGNLKLTAPEQVASGQPMTLRAVLSDSQGKPLSNVPVTFFIKTHFFATGLMEIGEAITNNQGIAVFDYTSRQSGEVEVVARYGEGNSNLIETATTVNLIASPGPFYQTEAGIHLTAPWEEVFIGPSSTLNLGEWGNAPMTAFRLPGSIVSWLLLLVLVIMLIWFTYFRVMRQVFLIPIASEIREINTRLIPMVGMAIVLFLGTTLTLMILTGPYTHLHLLR